MPSFLCTELYTAKVVAQANLEGDYAAEQPDVDGAAWFVERKKICECLSGAWLCGAARQILHIIGPSAFCVLDRDSCFFALPFSPESWSLDGQVCHAPSTYAGPCARSNACRVSFMSSGRNSRFAARKLNVGDLNDNARAKWQAECDAPWPAAVNQLQDLTLLFACWQGLVAASVFMTSKAVLSACFWWSS